MATMIDELVIKLGLDNSSFRSQVAQSQENVRKVSDEAQKQAKLIEAAGQRAASFFTKLRNEALALFALFVGTSSIKNFIQQTTLANAALGQTAKNIGITTRELSAWQMAAERAQGSAEGITNSMRSLQADFQTSVLTGQNTQSMNVLAQMGIMVQDPHHPGQMRPIDEIMKDVSDKMQGMSQPQRQALGRMLGLDEGTINLLSKGRGELDKLLEEMRRLGTVSDEDAKVGQDLINSFKGVGDAVRDVGRAILTGVSPFLTDMLNGMKEWIVQNKEWLKTEISAKIREFGDWLKSIDWRAVRKDIDDFLDKTNEVVKALGGWKTILEAIFLLWAGEKFAGMIRGIKMLLVEMGPLVAAFLAIKTAIDAFNSAEKMAGDPTKWSPNSPFWRDMSKEEQLKYPNSPASREANPGAGREPMSAPGAIWDWTKRRLGFGPASFTADLSMSNDKKTALDALSVGESGGRYDAQNPGSSAHGRYQFINSTEAEIIGATGVSGSDPASQDKRGWYLMARTYNRATGRDLEADIKSGGHDEEIATALNKVWPSLPGGSQQNTTMAQWKARMDAGRQRYGTQVTAQADPSLLRGSKATAMNNSRTTTTTTNSDSTTHVNGPINIQTAATDSDGIAKGIGSALRKYLPVQEANYGLA